MVRETIFFIFVGGMRVREGSQSKVKKWMSQRAKGGK
jgi:hypothetical protein